MKRHHCLLLSFVLVVHMPVFGYGHHDDEPILLGALFPRFSDAGESIVFSYQGSIWRVPRSGGVMTQVTAGEGFDVEPTWSPDDKLIAFIRGRSSFVGPLQLIKYSPELNPAERVFEEVRRWIEGKVYATIEQRLLTHPCSGPAARPGRSSSPMRPAVCTRRRTARTRRRRLA